MRALSGHHTTWKETGQVVREMNQVSRGWGNYFALANHHRCFGQMNDFIAHRLRQWLWRKHGHPAGKYERWPSRELVAADGLHRLRTTSEVNGTQNVNGIRKAGCGKTACPV